MDNSVIDLTLSDYSDGEENQPSDGYEEEETEEFPYKCLQCPAKFKVMAEAQNHFFQNHQHSSEIQNRGKRLTVKNH